MMDSSEVSMLVFQVSGCAFIASAIMMRGGGHLFGAGGANKKGLNSSGGRIQS